MIISKEVKIKVSARNINKIKDFLKIDTIKINDIVEVPINIISDGSHVKVLCECDVCGKTKEIFYQKYIKNIKNGNYYACSSKCAQNKVKKTSLEKYGEEYYMKTDEYKNRTLLSNNEKYNSDFYLTSNIGKEIVKNTNLNKYGFENPFSNKLVKQKIKNTFLNKYGVDNPSKSDKIKEILSEKTKETWQKKYKEFYKKNNLNIIDYSNNIYTIACDKNHKYEISNLLLQNRIKLNTETCTICNPYNLTNTSGYELQLREYIQSLINNKLIIFNDRNVISPHEIDIYIPDLNLAFEFNGLYWHSNKYKDKYYHYNKHKLCKEKNIELFQIWEDDWIYKNDIIKSMIRNKLKVKCDVIYARNCEVGFIDHKISNDFLKKNHLKGNCNSKYNIALTYNGKIVSLMTFGKLRNSLGYKNIKDDIFELHRFCNLLDINVVGGASKMLSYFKKNIKFSEIITYYDKSFGYNNLYDKIGFEFVSETKLDYNYIINNIRVHRYKYRKQNLVKMGYDINKTENEIINELNILKIYGVGNYKYNIKNYFK